MQNSRGISLEMHRNTNLTNFGNPPFPSLPTPPTLFVIFSNSTLLCPPHSETWRRRSYHVVVHNSGKLSAELSDALDIVSRRRTKRNERRPRRLKGHSHIRCSLLRCAGKNASCVLQAQRSNAQRMCERPLKVRRPSEHIKMSSFRSE